MAAKLMENDKQISSLTTDIKQKLDELSLENRVLRREKQALKQEIVVLRENVKQVEGSMRTTNFDMQSAVGIVQALKQEIVVLHEDVKQIKENMHTTKLELQARTYQSMPDRLQRR